MAISIQFRKDSAENWETNNPILLEGELGAIIVDNDNGISSITEFKIGNGVNHWNDLPLVSTNSKFSDNDITEILQNIQDINNSINMLEEDISVIADISSNVQTNSNNISDINLRILDIATDISSANTNISAVYENIVNTTDSFYTRLNDMETAVCSTIISAASKASVNSISENISILALSADTINKNVDNINSNITDNLYEVSTVLKNSINSLEDDYETVSDDIDNINVKISNISSEISSKAEIAHTHEISSINNLESRILALNSDISTNRDNIEEVSTYIRNNVLTDTSIIPANNISVNDTSLDTVINSKLDVENDTIHVDKIVLGNTFITANEINDGISSYNFNNLATKDDLTTLSANVAAASTKLSGITITPADTTSNNAQWVIYKDGSEESVNKIIISQDYYDSAYHPTRLPSRYEVDNTISSNIENHNISIDAHQNIIEPISTLIFEHRTESETKLETLSADISTIHTNIADLQDHYNDSTAKFTSIDNTFSSITADISNISAITINVPNISSELNAKIDDVVLTNNIEHLTLSQNIDSVSADVDNIRYRIVALDEARWIPYTDISGNVFKNIETIIDSDNYTNPQYKPFGLYFTPMTLLSDVDKVSADVNNISLKTFSINTIDDDSWYNSTLVNVEVIAIAYIKDGSKYYEIGRSLNSVNITEKNMEYIFNFHNCIAKLRNDITNNVIYIRFAEYSTGNSIKPPISTIEYNNTSDNIIGIIVGDDEAQPNFDIGRIANTFINTDIVFDYVKDVIEEIQEIKDETENIKDEITSALSEDNVVLGWNTTSSELVGAIPSISSKLLTVNTAPLYETVENEIVSCFPYTGTNEVLLRDDIRVTGTPGIGSIKNGDVLQIGDNVTDILKQMLQVELPITVINPTGSFKLYNTDDNDNNLSELTTGRYLYGTKHNFLAIFKYNDGIYIKDPNATGTDCSSYASANVVNNGYKIVMEYPNTSEPNFEFTSNSVSADNDRWKFATDTSALKINGYITYNTANPPVNNIGEQTDGTISGRTISVGSITLTPFGYGYMGYDVGTAAINSSTITALPKISDNLNWLTNGKSFNLTLPTGASCKRFIIAYPDSLNDISKIEYVEDGNTNYTSNFSKSSVNVTIVNNKQLGYKLYTYGTSADSFWNGPVTFKITL